MPEFTKIKVSTDQHAFETSLAISEGRIEFYQNSINLIKNIIPEFVFESADLKTLFNNPKSYLVDKIISEPTTIGGLELSKDKVFELLEDSDKLKNVVNYVDSLKKHNSTDLQTQRSLQAYTDDYEINENAEVFLKETAIENLENQFSIFVKNQRQKDSHDSLILIKNELEKLATRYSHSHIKFIQENLKFNGFGLLLGIDYKNLSSLE